MMTHAEYYERLTEIAGIAGDLRIKIQDLNDEVHNEWAEAEAGSEEEIFFGECEADMSGFLEDISDMEGELDDLLENKEQ